MSECKNCGQEKDVGVYGTEGFYCYEEACWQRFIELSQERTRQQIQDLISQGLCYFDKAWIGRCKKPGAPFCDEHSNLKCVSCGAQATHECPETGGLVCGFPLCDGCEHTIHPEGHNGGVGFNEQPLPEGMNQHCKKSEQRFQPWYAREPEAKQSDERQQVEQSAPPRVPVER
jgi:hypothetical protein